MNRHTRLISNFIFGNKKLNLKKKAQVRAFTFFSKQAFNFLFHVVFRIVEFVEITEQRQSRVLYSAGSYTSHVCACLAWTVYLWQVCQSFVSFAWKRSDSENRRFDELDFSIHFTNARVVWWPSSFGSVRYSMAVWRIGVYLNTKIIIINKNKVAEKRSRYRYLQFVFNLRFSHLRGKTLLWLNLQFIRRNFSFWVVSSNGYISRLKTAR